MTPTTLARPSYSLAVGVALHKGGWIHKPAIPTGAADHLLKHVAALIGVRLERERALGALWRGRAWRTRRDGGEGLWRVRGGWERGAAYHPHLRATAQRWC